MRPLACLLLLASTGAESWKSWLARGAAGGFQNFVHATAEIDDARTSAHSLRIDGKVLSVKELEFALLGARLAFLAYARSRWEVEAGLKDARMELYAGRWRLRAGGSAAVVPGAQRRGALPGVSRSSVFDVLDLMAMPEDGTEDDRFADFLHAVLQAVAAPVAATRSPRVARAAAAAKTARAATAAARTARAAVAARTRAVPRGPQPGARSAHAARRRPAAG